MKRIIKSGLLFFIAAIITGAVFKMQQTLSTKNEQAAKLRQRPTLSAVHFVSTSLAPMIDGKPTLIILFNSECEHCQYEAGQLQKRHQEFARASVYLLTTEPPVRAQAFARQYGLDTLSMMHVGTLTQEESYKAFGPTSVPHLFIYGPDGQLRKEYKGETKIDALLKYL
jgi:peroxiredoxin